MIRPSRVRRLRTRRAWRSAVVAFAMATVSLVFVQAQAKDVHGVGVWVLERSDVLLLGKAAGTSAEAAVSAVGAGASAGSVRVVVSGKVHDIVTNAGSVGELLSAMGIYPDADDRVVPSPETPLHSAASQVFVDLVDVRLVTATVPVPFQVSTTYTNTLGIGVSDVVVPGRQGRLTRVVEQTVVNGTVVSSRVMSSVLLRPPVTQIEASGPAGPDAGTLEVPGIGGRTQTGQASWYDPPWSGFSAAHPWLPKGTLVTVTDLDTGRSVTVVIDDRGPFAPGRVIDLSPEAFGALAPLSQGVLRVRLDW